MSPADRETSQPAETITLPNGLLCSLPSARMRRIAGTTIREVFKGGRYQRPGFELRPDDTVIDLGANIGIFTLWASPQVPHGRIFAVEPSPAIDILRANLELNHVLNVATLQAAVGKADGTIEMVFYPLVDVMTHDARLRHNLFMRFLMLGARSERLTAPTVSLGQVLERSEMSDVGYLKIDCEGGEYDICRSASAADWRRIRRVSLEFHEYSSGHSHAELVEILRRNDFNVEVRTRWWQRGLTRTGEIWASR